MSITCLCRFYTATHIDDQPLLSTILIKLVYITYKKNLGIKRVDNSWFSWFVLYLHQAIPFYIFVLINFDELKFYLSMVSCVQAQPMSSMAQTTHSSPAYRPAPVTRPSSAYESSPMVSPTYQFGSTTHPSPAYQPSPTTHSSPSYQSAPNLAPWVISL